MNSILQEEKDYCFLCGCESKRLDKHHVFGASNRNKSERYGLFVYLCHDTCHIFGNNSVHKSRAVSDALKKHAQEEAMRVYGWTVEEFIKEFGRNYT